MDEEEELGYENWKERFDALKEPEMDMEEMAIIKHLEFLERIAIALESLVDSA
jgi:hypothetical protein